MFADNAIRDTADMEMLAIQLVETKPDLLPELPKIGGLDFF